MSYLVNTGSLTLLEQLGEEIEKTIVGKKQEKYSLYLITCYFDVEALKKLIEYIEIKIIENQSTLYEVSIFIDIADWIKSKQTVKTLTKKISKILISKKINIYPVNYSGQLFHAKSYCLVSRNKRKKGFVLTTSGNLTMRGLGINEYGNNIEISHITRNIKSIISFLKLTRKLKKKIPSPNIIERQDKYILALRIFSKGSFYHKWEGGLGREVRFKLDLTKKGIRVLNSSTGEFGNYEGTSKSISRDPLKLEEIFNKVSKPFPQQFWGQYSIDTIFGRWVPSRIDKLIDKILEENVEPYINLIKEKTKQNNLYIIKEELLREVESFNIQGYIKSDPKKTVESWLLRIKNFRKNTELISTIIFSYEKLPDIIDISNRKSVLKLQEKLVKQVGLRTKTTGIKSIVYDEICSPNRKQYNSKIRKKYSEAKNKLDQHKKMTKSGKG